ncbi:hypothetical protein [Hydrogenophaga sp. BPS33]|uniref:hypothetical protein n=1 Tax=Hydrogenophaga sp. BPS33 TaxID=2651974 RepID=UPI00131FD671|nr:hypothetical protein [Hydrogenophaga sp. BPS33]QHE85027.1 hypothetical protein F9K07_09080 [Hydrogenophaga sp. BPS33]
MALRGTAFLAIWHDIEPALEEEFHHWHTEEHLPERVLTPGIVTGSRYWNAEAHDQRCFTLYEASSFEVFASEGYFMTANARSPWTQRVHPGFLQFTRAPCHLAITRGRGTGGAMGTLRMRLATEAVEAHPPLPLDQFRLRVRDLVEDATRQPGVIAAHAGIKGNVERRPMNDGALSMRAGATDFDAVVLIEGISRHSLTPVLQQCAEILNGWSGVVSDCKLQAYDLAHRLHQTDL